MCTFTLPVFVLQSKAKSIRFEQSECILSNFPYTFYVWLCDIVDIVCCVQNERDLQLTQKFNSMVLDFCDALWRNMIFKKKSKTSYPTLAFDLPRWACLLCQHLPFNRVSLPPSFFRDLLESCSILQPHKRLNLVHHPALIGLVIQFFMEVCCLPFYSPSIRHSGPILLYSGAYGILKWGHLNKMDTLPIEMSVYTLKQRHLTSKDSFCPKCVCIREFTVHLMSMSELKVEKGLSSHDVHVLVLSIECSFYLSTIVIVYRHKKLTDYTY